MVIQANKHRSAFFVCFDFTHVCIVHTCIHWLTFVIFEHLTNV